MWGPVCLWRCHLPFSSQKAVTPTHTSAHSERVEGQRGGGCGVCPELEDILARSGWVGRVGRLRCIKGPAAR